VEGLEAGDALEERRLPRTVGADEPDYLVLADLQRHAGESLYATEGNGDARGLEDGLAFGA
jgi:hypothetical protein